MQMVKKLRLIFFLENLSKCDWAEKVVNEEVPDCKLGVRKTTRTFQAVLEIEKFSFDWEVRDVKPPPLSPLQ